MLSISSVFDRITSALEGLPVSIDILTEEGNPTLRVRINP